MTRTVDQPDTDAMRAFALSRVGCGYAYGATGWVCTPQRRARQAAQYPAQARALLDICKKWDGKQCYDCAQLTRLSAAAGGVILPSGATGQWTRGAFSARGPIALLPRDRVALVFVRSGRGARHVGLYLGDGGVTHAKGSRSGVVREALEKGKWTDYALFLDALPAEKTLLTTAAPSGATVNLRAGPDARRPVLLRVPLGESVELLEADDAWARVRYQGTEGYVMRRYLE